MISIDVCPQQTRCTHTCGKLEKVQYFYMYVLLLLMLLLLTVQWLAEKLDFLANYYVNEVTSRGQKPPLNCC